MLTCVYQPPLPLSKNCLLKVNRDTKKVIVSKFSEEKGGRVKVELANNNNDHHHQNLQQIHHQHSLHHEPSLPETCGLSISELEAMAARQARQLSTQDQLLAAKAQRLRFLKSGGEAERLQRLREKVATQEERLRKLRALRGKVQNSRGSNSALTSDLESLRAVFNEKEKELSLAVAKVEDLTRQLDDLRRGGKEPPNGQSVAAVELEKLRRELMYRQKLREAQHTRVAAQRAALSQRQEEAMRVDRRIAELQERLHRKRLLNHQLAATLKHQESVEDFVSVPSKSDPKYQTLPYNAKLFAPFANKHDRDNFEKSMRQMQIIHLDTQQPQQQQQQQNQHQQQQQQQQQYHQQQNQLQQLQQSNKSNQVLKYPNNNVQLHHLLSQNHAKSANHHQQQQLSAPSLSSLSHAVALQSSGSPVPIPPTTATSGIVNGPQTVHSTLASNASRGKAIFGAGSSNSGSHANENSFPFALPNNNFGPTGAPASIAITTSASGSMMPNSTSNSLQSNQVGSTKETSSAGSSVSDGFASNGHNSGSLNLISSGTPGSGRKPVLDEPTEVRASFWKPALPPKPTPPPRQASSERESGSGVSVMPDRTELPIKPKPLFLKKSSQNTTVSSIGSANLSSGASPVISIEKEQSTSGNSNSATVRVSISRRRIEMPPAFLFPESDPPPSDLVPEHPSPAPSAGGSSTQPSQSQSEDSVDATALQKPSLLPEEYTLPIVSVEEYMLPDLFPHPPNLSNNMKNSSIPITAADRINANHSATSNLNMTSILSSTITTNNNNTNHGSSASFQNITSKSNDSMSIVPALNNNNIKEYNRDSYFVTNQNQNQQFINTSPSSPTISNATSSKQQTSSNLSSNTSSSSATMNNMNLIRSANINLSPSLMTDGGSEQTVISEHQQQQQQHFQHQQQQPLQSSDLENVNHVSVMSIQVSEENSLGDLKMDLSPIQLESYEVIQEQPIGDPNNDRDENASDSTNSGSTITTTTSSVSSGSGGAVVRRVKDVQKKGNLKSTNRDHAPLGRRVSFDPLALLLDASLEGELDLVVKTAGEVGNASAANDEGITALHNAICAGHAEVVRFLVEFGCDVNAQDSDGWTPLHCAASCNNVGMVKFLVERGACIFATTLSDHETAAEKCEEDEDGHLECEEYLTCIQEKLGIMNSGVVYAVFDYEAQNPDELGFREGDHLMILRKGDEFEREWWWARLGDKQGYVPRNLLGLYPRVVPHKINES